MDMGCKTKASLTIEAALVLPLFLLVMTTILAFLDIYRLQPVAYTSMLETGEEIAMYAYKTSGKEAANEVISSAVCIGKVTMDFQKRWDKSTGHTCVFYQSDCENEKIDIKGSAHFESPVGVVLKWLFPVKFTAVVRQWTGYDPSVDKRAEAGSETEMVYVTEFESVYHTSSDCTHLDLHITEVSKQTAENKKNEYGDTYHACDKCMTQYQEGDSVYISEKGTHYHSSSHCSGLTRTVHMVEKSEIEGLPCCSRCQEKTGG